MVGWLGSELALFLPALAWARARRNLARRPHAGRTEDG